MQTLIKTLLAVVCVVMCAGQAHAQLPDEDGYEMWLRYQGVADPAARTAYRSGLQRVVEQGDSAIIRSASSELARGLRGLLDAQVPVGTTVDADGAVVIGTPSGSSLVSALGWGTRLAPLGTDGFLIDRATINGRSAVVVAANGDAGVLYGVFHLLRHLQTHRTLETLATSSAPKVDIRIVNHWDNLNRRNVERGYGGLSLWDWGSLPEYRHPRYTDYARVNASLGINATVVNNVNADPRMLTDQFLEKAAVLADMFRPWGIKLYLSINFDSPRRIGGLKTADPLDPSVQQWWREQIANVYKHVPDFGGFLVKADSEGQPGPYGYGRNHADGANMLADGLRNTLDPASHA